MNRIVIIGNGFDLAHGLKTKYEDFIFDYFKTAFKSCYENPNGIYKDELMELTRDSTAMLHDKFKNISDILEHPYIYFEKASIFQAHLKDKSYYHVKYKSPFFAKIITNKNWTDVESAYFEYLINLTTKENNVNQQLENFHKEFDELKSKLITYLEQIEFLNNEDNPKSKKELIDNCFLTIRDIDFDTHFKAIPNFNFKLEKVYFINFNYTNLLEKYLPKGREDGEKYHLTYIHGKLSDKENIVFGYGDDTHPYYKELEYLNDNEVLSKMKSFYYPANSDYIDLINFIESNIFDVQVIGHSLGVSDRVLLKTIFENKNCILISLFHQGKDSHFRKRIALSRHFDNKLIMRNKIKPYDEMDEM